MILAVSAAARAIFFGLAVVCFVLAAVTFVRGKLTQVVWIALGLALTVFVFFLEAADGL